MFNYFYKIFPYKPTILSFWGTPIYGNPHMLCQQLSPAFLSVSPIVFPIAGRSLLDAEDEPRSAGGYSSASRDCMNSLVI